MPESLSRAKKSVNIVMLLLILRKLRILWKGQFMKGRAILVSLTIAMSLTVFLLGGCELNEKAELQKTIEDQKAAIEELQDSREVVIRNFLEVSRELEVCQKRLGEVEKEYELFKKARQFTPTELQKGLAELKAAREAAAKRLREEAAAEANEP
jgi:hypothetical protein